MLAAFQALAQAGAPHPGVPWPATDALGRALPVSAQVRAPRPERFVGIFYFLWLNERHNHSPLGPGPRDINRILAADPEALQKPDSPLWGGVGVSHYWGEPLYGYYLSTDPWVLRRHAQLLADAGIDTLIFDTTNAQTYPGVYTRLCEVFTAMRAEGLPTPQIAFMVNTEAGATARQLYQDLYKPGRFRELWFLWLGKPLLICDPNLADAELQSFFTLRRAHWPFTRENTPYAWHWEAAYPQTYGFTDDPARPEQVNVSVAQNLAISNGLPVAMSDGNARGRSFHDGRQDPAPDAILRGFNFAEQWQRALALDPPFVMITGWNEWIAGRWTYPGKPLVFVDQFTQEYSRDIEPARASHGDNYYWQMVAGIRRFKGAPALPCPSPPRDIPIPGRFDRWTNVLPVFADAPGDTAPRDCEGAGTLHYRNDTGRNDIVACRVARSRSEVFFLVETRAPLTPGTGSNWMWLFLDTDRNPTNGWEGFDYLVRREGPVTRLEKNTGGWSWRPVQTVQAQAEGSRLQLALPRRALGLPRGTDLTLDFQWADHLQRPGDIMDFYVSGDVAPEGRYRYRYDTRAGKSARP